MIDKECFTPEWIEDRSIKLGYSDRNLIEKSIRAFSLLDMLSVSGCPYCFKGGSSLMLLLKDARHRLSIDIDIICPPGTDIEKYLGQYEEFGFTDFKIIDRQQRGIDIPKSHSKFFYQVSYKDGLDMTENILLDVLNEDCHYNDIWELPIDSPLIKNVGTSNIVKVPSPGDILGDKLTAFAPNTTGIPYLKNGIDKGLEIVKQMYDIARLFDKIDNLETTAMSFKRIASVEMAYRHLENDHNAICEDIRDTALCLTTQGHAGRGQFDSLQKGLTRIKSFMFGNKYTFEDAVRDVAIAAYIATLLQTDNKDVEKYNGNPETVAELKISSSLTNRLNRLKRFQPEAYFYWAKTGELLDKL